MRLFSGMMVLTIALANGGAQAADVRFGIDQSVNLDTLKQAADPSNMPMPVQNKGNLFQLDGSAVFHSCDAAHAGCTIDKLWLLAQDYNDYVKFKMPDLKQSVVVENDINAAAGDDTIYAWNDMEAFLQESTSYLEVHVEPSGLATGERAMYWQSIAPHPGWTYANNPAFADFHGSWYMQDLGGGDIYVRYYLSATSKGGLENILIGGRLQSDARKTATILWQQSLSATMLPNGQTE